MTTTTKIENGDYDLRGRDLDQRFARFGSHALSDEEVCALSLASMVTPDACPAAEIYLLHVSHARVCIPTVRAWGLGVARGLAAAKYKGRGRQRRRTLVEGYKDTWGQSAVDDAIMLLMYGECPGIGVRADANGVGKQAYQRVRDLVHACFCIAIAEYKLALGWAMGYRRDSLLESRWGRVSGLKWDGVVSGVNVVGQEGDDISSRGTWVVPRARDNADRVDPRTQWPGIWNMDSPHRS